MIENILNTLKETDYDFRIYASDNDPLKHLFPEWVKDYQLKYAISKVLQPKSILDIGGRFGYSAITFLEASPKASYTGIDIDTNAYSNVKGAIEWAEKITLNYETNFIIADATQMQSFPGDFYDLIHVNTQQNADKAFGILEKALEKGRYILVDGYFLSKSNMLSRTYFLDKYKDFIEYALIIPGYSGELLIKTKSNAKNIFSQYTRAYETLVDSYDSNYYLNDCGGYETFIRTSGTEITDHRLLAAIYLARPDRTKKILDVGSGRGELAYALSKSSLHVTGLDYSKDATIIAQQTFKDIDNLDFVQADILKFDTDENFDVVLATDVVEHIEEEMLLKMFDKVKNLLNRNGMFIVHTAPNKLNYMYEYAKKYKIAKEIGIYIPENPRTYYEDMMHINEQTPGRLNKGLKKSFENVFVWTASAPDFLGDFGRQPNKEMLKKNESIYAICSNGDLNKNDIAKVLIQRPLNHDTLKIDMTLLGDMQQVIIDEYYDLQVKIRNNSGEDFASLLPFPVNVSYHWKKDKGDEYVVYDGLRTSFKLPLAKRSEIQINMSVIAPEKPGSYILELTMVQEGQFWFEQIIPSLPIKLMVDVQEK